MLLQWNYWYYKNAVSKKDCDKIIKEPLGGAHNDPETVANQLKSEIEKILDELIKKLPDELVNIRIKKLMKIGRWSE